MGIERYNDGPPLEQHRSDPVALTAADLAADSVTASEIATDAVDSAEIKAGAVGTSEIATDGVGSDEIAANAVGSSELASGVVPCILSIPCTKPAVAEAIAYTEAPAPFTASLVRMRVGTMPAAGAAFSWNVRNGTAGYLFASDNVFEATPAPNAFYLTADSDATFTNLTPNISGAGVSSIGALDTLANGDALYVGYPQQFCGLVVDLLTNLNSEVSTLAVHYWNGAWAAVANLTDGTASGGATMAQDGSITWDTPVDWIQRNVDAPQLYWVRLTVSAALSAAVDVDNLDIIRDTAVSYYHTPAQNLSFGASADIHIVCTEADATADDVTVTIQGTYDF